MKIVKNSLAYRILEICVHEGVYIRADDDYEVCRNTHITSKQIANTLYLLKKQQFIMQLPYDQKYRTGEYLSTVKGEKAFAEANATHEDFSENDVKPSLNDAQPSFDAASFATQMANMAKTFAEAAQQFAAMAQQFAK